MTASYRFALLTASVTAALALSACQPTSEDIEAAAPKEEIMPPPVEVSESDINADAMDPNDMSDVDAMEDDVEMTDMLKDYTKSMSKMHAEMMIGMGYNDPDTAFAKSMLGHHRGAVDMAKIELKYGTDPALLKLAQEIMDAQQIEIDILRKWLASHPDASSPKPDTLAMQQAYAESIDEMHGNMMVGIEDPVPDMAFARSMLHYHIGAVEMAKVQLEYGTDEEMRKLAQDIIEAQQPEIEVMQDWITRMAFDIEEANNLSDSAQTNSAQ